MKSVFVYIDYRLYFKDWLSSQKQQHGLLSLIADSLQCQNSHLSRVLKEEVHLTLDQAYLLTEFMKMSDKESQFFMKLVEFDRSSSLNYRNKLKKEIEALKAEVADLSKRFKQSEIQNKENEMLYYSHWLFGAIHSLVEITRFQTAKALSQRLLVDERIVKEYLEKLESMGLVTQKNNYWVRSNQNLHLSKNSPMTPVNHQSWRTRAVYDSQNHDSRGIHYTVLQAVSKTDIEKIKFLFLETIGQYKQIADPSLSEDVICFNLDFFEI